GIVSNFTSRSECLRYEIGRHGMLEFFDVILVSSEMGLRKPHPLLFRTALAQLDLPATAVWYVGDLPDRDIVGAKGVGMTSIWFNPRGARNETGMEPDAQITSWGEFGSLLS